MQSGLLPEALMMSWGFVASGGHADVTGMGSHLRPCWDPGAHEADKGHEWVGGPDVAKAHVDVYGPDCHLRTYSCLCSGLLPQAKDAKEMALPLLGEQAPPLVEEPDGLSPVKAWRHQLCHGLGRATPLTDSNTIVPTMVWVWERQPHNTGSGVGKGEEAPFSLDTPQLFLSWWFLA